MFDGNDDGGLGFGDASGGADMYEQVAAQAQSAPQPQKQAQPTLGAEEDLTWVQSYIDGQLTPEFMSRQAEKVANDPEFNAMVGRRLRPYVYFVIPLGFLVGMAGAWVFDKWSGFRRNPAVRAFRFARRALR